MAIDKANDTGMLLNLCLLLKPRGSKVARADGLGTRLKFRYIMIDCTNTGKLVEILVVEGTKTGSQRTKGDDPSHVCRL